MEDSTWWQNNTLLPVTIFKNGFSLVSKKKCRWREGPAASWCLWAPSLSHRGVFDILSCDWYGATAKRRKRKVICRACHQAFRCGMWNFLSLLGFLYLQCCGNFLVAAICSAVRKIVSSSPHFGRMPPTGGLVNGDFRSVDFSARVDHSWGEMFIAPMSTFTRLENQREQAPRWSGKST